MNQTKSENVCKRCKKPISPKRVFCSKECYTLSQKSGDYRWQTDKRIKNRWNCKYCGKPVIRCKGKGRNGKRKINVFCDRNCYDNYRKSIVNTTTCKYCGTQFLAIGTKKANVFCNDDCRRKYFAQNCVNYCVVCGGGFFPWTFKCGRLILYKATNTCSEKCKKRYNEQQEILRREKISIAGHGEGHWNWQGGRATDRGVGWTNQRRLARERDGNRCMMCGMSKKEHYKLWNRNLEVHHKVPIRKFDDKIYGSRLDNLVTLCARCHQKAETAYRKGVEYEDYVNKKSYEKM